jgi:ENTS family enterobactin (siderophore) exporter
VLTSGGLALNATLAHPSIAVIYLVSATAAGLGGVISTVRNAAVPAVIGDRLLMAGYASMQVVDQVAMVVAPALSGLLIGALHLRWIFAIVAVAYLLAAVAALRMSAIPGVAGAPRPGLGSVVGGLRYLRGRQVLQGVFLIDINAMVFGPPRALFPAMAISVFHGGASTLGYLYAAPAAGALVGALTTGWLERIRRHGGVVVVAVAGWGTAIVTFGLVDVLWIALVLLALAGWADVTSAVSRTTMLQSVVPDALRARISSLQIAVVEGGPRLGDLEAGWVAGLTSTEFSVVSGGLACIVGAVLIAGVLSPFRHYHRHPQPSDGR